MLNRKQELAAIEARLAKLRAQLDRRREKKTTSSTCNIRWPSMRPKGSGSRARRRTIHLTFGSRRRCRYSSRRRAMSCEPCRGRRHGPWARQSQCPAADSRGRGDGRAGANVRRRALIGRVRPSPNIAVDMDFGPETRGAVEKFQSQNGLDPTGVVDAATWRAINQSSKSRRKSKPSNKKVPFSTKAISAPRGPAAPPAPARSLRLLLGAEKWQPRWPCTSGDSTVVHRPTHRRPRDERVVDIRNGVVAQKLDRAVAHQDVHAAGMIGEEFLVRPIDCRRRIDRRVSIVFDVEFNLAGVAEAAPGANRRVLVLAVELIAVGIFDAASTAFADHDRVARAIGDVFGADRAGTALGYYAARPGPLSRLRIVPRWLP